MEKSQLISFDKIKSSDPKKAHRAEVEKLKSKILGEWSNPKNTSNG